jgi:hypothetical protein
MDPLCNHTSILPSVSTGEATSGSAYVMQTILRASPLLVCVSFLLLSCVSCGRGALSICIPPLCDTFGPPPPRRITPRLLSCLLVAAASLFVIDSANRFHTCDSVDMMGVDLRIPVVVASVFWTGCVLLSPLSSLSSLVSLTGAGVLFLLHVLSRREWDCYDCSDPLFVGQCCMAASSLLFLMDSSPPSVSASPSFVASGRSSHEAEDGWRTVRYFGTQERL